MQEQDVGDYELKIESFNTLSSEQSALLTESILITIKERIEEQVSLPRFKEELPIFMANVGTEVTWQLPDIYEGSHPLGEILIDMSYQLKPFITFDKDARKIKFNGNI